MSKGKIVLIPFPFTDLSGKKIRPALIIASQNRSDDIIVVFISSILPKKTHKYEVTIKSSKQNGLKVDSCIKIDKIATLHKKIVIGEIGELEKNNMDLINKKLKELFNL